MTEMNKSTVNALRLNVDKLLQGLPKEFSGRTGNATYDPTAGTVTFKVTISIKALAEAPDAYKRTPEYRDLVDFCKMGIIDLNPEMLEKTFDIPGAGVCKLVGYKARSTKFPYIVSCIGNGKRYKVSELSLKHAVRFSH